MTNDSASLPDFIEVTIPDKVVRTLHSSDELDAYVRTRADKLGTLRVMVRIEPALAEQIQLAPRISDPSTVADVTPFVSGAGAAAVVGSSVCGGKSATNLSNGGRSRRMVLKRSIQGFGAVALAAVLGKRALKPRSAAAGCTDCPLCSNSCYFSNFYGEYVNDCFYYYPSSGCSTYCATARYYNIDCNGPQYCFTTWWHCN